MTNFPTRFDTTSPAPWQMLATGAATGGVAAFGEARMPPRTPGPNLHVHTREDESIYVIEGTFTVQLGEEVIDVQAGELMWLPRGVPHTFANRSDAPVRAVGAIVPAGIEAMFEEQSAYFASLTGPPDEAVIEDIGARYGVTRVGPPLAMD